MKKALLLFVFTASVLMTFAQKPLTPEILWQLGRVSAVGLTPDGQQLVYRVSTPDMAANKIDSKYYQVSIAGGPAKLIEDYKPLIKDKNISPDGQYILFSETAKILPVNGVDFYPELDKSNVQVYESLDYRHWDTWNTGEFNHVFFRKNTEGAAVTDIMKGEAFNSPTKPFGGDEDFVWTPDSKGIVYVCKKKTGTEYAKSTNTDLYLYDIASGKTTNLTDGMPGYDTNPSYSSTGNLAWLSMARDGYEADKNDLIVDMQGIRTNLTKNWDGTVDSYLWSKDGTKIYFTAPVSGTIQLFEVDFPGRTKKLPIVKQLTDGVFDVGGIVGLSGGKVILYRMDMNRANEIYSFDLKTKAWQQITTVNDEAYSKIAKSKIEKRMVKTTDGKDMLAWVVYPPDFDPNKKYPTLLYCQGGPQSALTQFYSFRWNFQVMAAAGYIVVAPNRRGMPGHGVEWNEAISKDWGGQAMRDYISAVDDISKEPFVDKGRIGAIGASFGGYSVFYLAGMHENRFKTFISHCGVFNLESMYGTTEELFFVNWDMGGAYWEKDNKAVQIALKEFNPINNVAKWNTPMLIIQGGKDYRVPIGQGQEAFQAAQLQGIKSKFIFFPEENHWVLKPQNGLIWQREFFNWLKETL
jgi:dipeptidyl aminopeptidase/acylaminoacyl peptidase